MYAGLFKEHPECGIEYGRTAAQFGDFEMAAKIWERACHARKADAGLLAQVANEMGTIGLYSKSRSLHFEAARLDPKNLGVQIKAAWLLSRTNGLEEAREAVNRCATLDPHAQESKYFHSVISRREEKLDVAEQQLRDLLSSVASKPHVRYACYSDLAQILDRTGRHDEAISVSEEGKTFARRHNTSEAGSPAFFARQDHEVKEARRLPKNILETWTRAFPAEKRSPAPPLAFLSGSARSGTTLLERILDAHPSVVACDEVLAFQRIHPQIDITAPSIPAQRLDILRQRYLKNLTTELPAPPDGQLIIDKNPGRTFWLPTLLRAFPDLRVLIGLRDPRDVVISLYFQDHPNTNCLNFSQLVKRYAGVMDVWLAVREWSGLAWMETRYEDVVADLRAEGGRVTEFLGLTWHENQARFHEKNHDKPVLSTNYSGVTKPVYTWSVGRWKAYEKYLAPVLPLLEPYCKEFGYS